MGLRNGLAPLKSSIGLGKQGLGWSRRWLHVGIVVLLTGGHTLVHYAILLPGVGEAVEHLPYFNFHVLHEAAYLVGIAYASFVFRLFGGVLAIITFGVVSIPFLLASRIDSLEYLEYGFTGPGNALTEFLVLLAVGVFIVVLNELWGRERDRRIAALEQLESAHRQLGALNRNIQTQLNSMFESLGEAGSIARVVSEELPPGPARERIAAFMHRVSSLARPQE